MKLGFIGTGNISSDVITGICKSKLANLDLQIPVITSEEILPVPINPNFIGL